MLVEKPNNKNVIDTITLNYNDRFIRRKKLVSDNNLEFLVNLPETISVNKDDGFLLDDGNVILIKNAKETLIEIKSEDLLYTSSYSNIYKRYLHLKEKVSQRYA